MDIRTLGSSSAGNGYLIDDGTAPLLLEAGLPLRKILAKAGHALTGVAGCLVSHEHGDHSLAVRDLIRLAIPCYMSRGTADALNLAPGHRLHIVEDRHPVRIGHWTVLPFRVVHDAAEPMGFVLDSGFGERVLFMTDTAYSPYTFQGLTHLMIECNYTETALAAAVAEGRTHEAMAARLADSHLSLETLIDLLKANDLSRARGIWLMHLSDANSDEAEMVREVQRATGVPTYACPR